MLLFWMLLSYARGVTSITPGAETAWYSAPNYRGTWDLIVSCVLTLVICVWSALHLNVPVESSRLRERNIRRIRWVLLGIFAPEVVVSTAFAQYLTARWLRSEIRGDVKYRNKDKVSMKFVHTFLDTTAAIIFRALASCKETCELTVTASGWFHVREILRGVEHVPMLLRCHGWHCNRNG